MMARSLESCRISSCITADLLSFASLLSFFPTLASLRATLRSGVINTAIARQKVLYHQIPTPAKYLKDLDYCQQGNIDAVAVIA